MDGPQQCQQGKRTRKPTGEVIGVEEIPSRFEPLWSIEDAANYLGVAVKTLYGWRWQNTGPQSYRVGRFVRYRPAEVRAWVDAQARVS